MSDLASSILRSDRRGDVIAGLLDIVLTTMNIDRIHPSEGERLASLLLRGEESYELVDLLLKTAERAEPEKTSKLLSEMGVAS